MSQAATSSVTVGSKVKITRVRDRIPAAMVQLLLRDASGTVKGFKMTDGSGVGVVVFDVHNASQFRANGMPCFGHPECACHVKITSETNLFEAPYIEMLNMFPDMITALRTLSSMLGFDLNKLAI